MPITPAQNQFFLYGWHGYAWASNPRPVSAGVTATPTAVPKGATVVIQLPAGSQVGKVTALAGLRSGAPDKKSNSVVGVASGGSATVTLRDLQTGKVYYVRGDVLYADGSQALTAVETQVTPT